jgi:hypothetical protein
MYTAKERAIFRYWNGKRHVWGDPVLLYERLATETGGDLVGLLDKADGKIELPPELTLEQQENARTALKAQANERIRDAVRSAFGMAPWNPEAEKPEDAGATAQECDDALDALYAFFDDQKKSAGDTPASELPSETSADGSLTGGSLASGGSPDA